MRKPKERGERDRGRREKVKNAGGGRKAEGDGVGRKEGRVKGGAMKNYVRLAHTVPPSPYIAFMTLFTNWPPHNSTLIYISKEQQISRS